MFGPSAGSSLGLLERARRPPHDSADHRPGANALVVVAAEGPTEGLASAILADHCGEEVAVRVVGAAPPRPIDWSALAFGDLTSLDGLAWADLAVEQRWPYREAADGAAELDELLARLRDAGLVAEGWVSQAGGVLGAIRDGARHLPRCRSVTLLLGPGRLRPPTTLVRLVARPALPRGCLPSALRTRRTTG